jgi:hypothetical protein
MFFEDGEQFGEIYFDPVAAFWAQPRGNTLKFAKPGAEAKMAPTSIARIGDIRYLKIILVGHADGAVAFGWSPSFCGRSAHMPGGCCTIVTDGIAIRAASLPSSSRANRSARNRLVLASLAADMAAASCLAVVQRFSCIVNSFSAFRRAASLFSRWDGAGFSMGSST